jgi:ribosomal-protein-alanine N-acetyltransferase
LPCLVRPMAKEDIPQVSVIDREAFPTMWPPVNFQNELTNRLAHYLVACDGTKAQNQPEVEPIPTPVPVRSFWGFRFPFSRKPKTANIIPSRINEYVTGFVGMWMMVDESHIINLAVRGDCRGKGIGELLLIASIDTAASLKAAVATLEVRVSNTIAQNLYTKYGFSQVGLRKKYYTDNNEDALIMTTDIITSNAFKQRFQKLKETHFQKLNNTDYPH